MKNHLIDARDFVSAAIRVAVFVPMYRAVVACEKRKLYLPHRIIHTSLHGQRRARGDWRDIKIHYFGY